MKWIVKLMFRTVVLRQYDDVQVLKILFTTGYNLLIYQVISIETLTQHPINDIYNSCLQMNHQKLLLVLILASCTALSLSQDASVCELVCFERQMACEYQCFSPKQCLLCSISYNKCQSSCPERKRRLNVHNRRLGKGRSLDDMTEFLDTVLGNKQWTLDN